MARIALVIGVNQAPAPSVPPLRYADDDAARWFDLLRSLGARTTILTTVDDDTRRLHPQAAAEASPPTRAGLASAVAALAADVDKARQNGVATELYVVYAGHGDKDDTSSWLTLEDGRLAGAALFHDVVARIGANRTHVVVDACYSYFLAYERGPGGRARPLSGFMDAERLQAKSTDEVGLLLSTSSTATSHEWEAFQAGVFSHEVRSGLLGAADADGDGLVSYREIAAFVERANAPVENPRFRPRVYARAPSSTEVLADLRPALREHRLEIGGARSGRLSIEDAHGVRLADLHAAAGARVTLVHPVSAGRLYIADLERGEELTIEPADGVDGVVDVDALAAAPPRAAPRGAAHDAFERLFSAPFSEADVVGWRPPAELPLADDPMALATTTTATATTTTAATAGTAAGASPLFVTGTVLLGAGVLAAGGLTAGALAFDAVLGDPASGSADKEGARAAGLASLAGAGAALAVAGAGALCAVLAGAP